MITPSFSLTATERVLPKLALDFTTASLDPRVTFTRTTGASNPATYVNSNGYIAAATNNQPRFDYDPVTLACKGLLIEESRTNLAIQSNDLTQSSWTKTNVSINLNASISPDGTSNANEIVENTVNSSHAAYLTFTGRSSSETLTYSLFVKQGVGTRWLRFNVGSGLNSYFNPTTGLWGTIASGYTAKTVYYGGGWYRVSLSGVTNATTVYLTAALASNDNVATYLGNGTSSLYIYGAQCEVGAFPTSYIPTTSAALTRNADVATMTGTNFSDWWAATSGAANVSVIPESAVGTRPLFQVDDNTANNIISLRGNVANPELYIKATTDQVQIDAGTIVADTAYKLTGAWNTDNCAAAQNGAAAVTDTSATIPTVTQARIGSDGTNYANAWLQKINYWQQRITDNETQAFSK